MSDYGKMLRYHRELAGLKQPELAKAINTSQANISRWELGQIIPGINFCEQLAKFYGITIDELIGLSDRPTPQTHNTISSIPTNAVSFIKEYEDIIPDKNFITMAKLYKEITPELRALTLGYIVGVLQNNGVNTKRILGY